MKDKGSTKLYKSHNEPQTSHCLTVHEDAYLSYKKYKVKKPCFNGHPKVHKYQYIQKHTIFVFFKNFSLISPFLESKTHTHTHTHTHVKKE